jgi:hypothetical protein
MNIPQAETFAIQPIATDDQLLQWADVISQVIPQNINSSTPDEAKIELVKLIFGAGPYTWLMSVIPDPSMVPLIFSEYYSSAVTQELVRLSTHAGDIKKDYGRITLKSNKEELISYMTVLRTESLLSEILKDFPGFDDFEFEGWSPFLYMTLKTGRSPKILAHLIEYLRPIVAMSHQVRFDEICAELSEYHEREQFDHPYVFILSAQLTALLEGNGIVTRQSNLELSDGGDDSNHYPSGNIEFGTKGQYYMQRFAVPKEELIDRINGYLDSCFGRFMRPLFVADTIDGVELMPLRAQSNVSEADEYYSWAKFYEYLSHL